MASRTTAPRKRANGEGSIRFDEGRKRWEGRITVGIGQGGKLVRRKVTGKTRAEVTKRMAEARDHADAGVAVARRDLTVARFLSDWVDVVLPGTVAPSTERQYRDVVRLYVIPEVGAKALRSLGARDVAAMLRRLDGRGLSPNTIRLARSVLRRALRWAEAEGLVTRNVAAIAFGVKVPAPEGRTLTPEQSLEFLRAVGGNRLEAAWVTMLGLGLRRGELLGLSWSDVSLATSPATVTVRRTLQRIPGDGLVLAETKTARSRRTLHLPAPVVRALTEHRRRQMADRLAAGPEWEAQPLGADLVFRTPFGTAVDPDNFRNLTYRVTEAAGLGRWSPHELRHSAASLLLAMNVPLKVVSEVLGHSSIRVTADVYGHLLDDAKAEAADAMARVMGG